MIDIETARHLLDLAGGSIRYWAEGIVTERAVQTNREQGVSAGDILRLSFIAPGSDLKSLTPQDVVDYFAQFPGVVESVDEDDADRYVQVLTYGEVRHRDAELSDDERRSLEAGMKGMRVEEEE